MSHRTFRAFLVGVALLITASLSVADGVPLKEFQRVVIDDDAMPVTKLAATELSTYAARVGQKELPIVPLSKFDKTAAGKSFFVGEVPAKAVTGKDLAPWKNEEYVLQTIPQGMVLAGFDEPGDAWSQSVNAGSALAVYTLLDDHLGVKWLWPGEFGEHVPNNPDAVVPTLDVRKAPAFVIRNYMVGYPGYRTLKFGHDVKYWTRRTRQGWVEPASFAHSWQIALDVRSAMAQKEPPEWLALVKGKRKGWQVCTTHPYVLDKMVEFVLNHKHDIVTISPNDGHGFCECNEQTKSETHKRLGIPSCTSYDIPGEKALDGHSPSFSERIYTYANTIAKRVREQNPKKSVGMFAYTYYTKPPKTFQHLEPNIYLSFVHQVMANLDPATEKEWKETMAAWHKLGAKIVMREGWGNHYLFDLPFPHEKQVMEGISYAHKNGIIAVYGEGSKAFANQGPTSWAVVRMMWDPTQDTSKILDEYFNAAYGPAAPEMKAFFATYRDARDKAWPGKVIIPVKGLGFTNQLNSWTTFYPPGVIEAADKRLQAAEAKDLPKEYADRVKFNRFGQEYTKTMIELFACYEKLAQAGAPVPGFVNPQKNKWDASVRAANDATLQRAFELGEKREQLLMQHRDWAAIDEGLYAATHDGEVRRQWHAAVAKELGKELGPRPTKERLKAMDKAATGKTGATEPQVSLP